MSRRRAFSLMEVLIAIALFGLAAAGLFMALQPAQEALVTLSEQPDDTGSLEIVRSVAEMSLDRSSLASGGEVPLPTGVTVRWSAELENTAVEALYRVTLTGERDGAPPLRATYLHFEPRWAEASEGTPQWLPHLSGASARPGASGSEKPGSKPGQKPGQKPGASGGKPGEGASRPGAGEGRPGGNRSPGGNRPPAAAAPAKGGAR